jgi:hypothetical protein
MIMPGLKNALLPASRVHVQGDRWQDSIGTDFWMHPALLMGTTVAGSNRLVDNGWTMEAEHGVAGSGGDFLGGALTAGIPADPGIPPHVALLVTGDLIVSPPVFGTYAHAMAAAAVCGKRTRPDRLIMDVHAAFTTASADEVTSGFGFFEDATTTTSATEALQLAFISSNSVTFELASNASAENTADAGAAVDNTWHDWRIELRYSTGAVATAYWYIDRALQGSIPITQDEAPYAFGAHVLTANVLKIGPVHIFYDWGI